MVFYHGTPLRVRAIDEDDTACPFKRVVYVLTALFSLICFVYVSASLFNYDTGVPVTSSICGP